MIQNSIPFNRNVDLWRQYSGSIKGRLRRELILRHIQLHIGSIQRKIKVLDAGCGLGEIAAGLLINSETMVLLDFSAKMLDEAKRFIASTHSASELDRFVFVNGPIEALESNLPHGFFDLILCHNVLEYVDDPRATLAVLSRRLAHGGFISIVSANRLSDPLKCALVRFDFKAARLALKKNDSTADVFDKISKRTFSLQEFEEMAGGLGLNISGRYGIRIFTDYLPEEVLERSGNERLLLDLEQDSSTMQHYISIARYLHLVCQK